MKTDAKNVNALCRAFDLGKAEGLRVAKEKYLDADAYNEGIADGRECAIEEFLNLLRLQPFPKEIITIIYDCARKTKEQKNDNRNI